MTCSNAYEQPVHDSFEPPSGTRHPLCVLMEELCTVAAKWMLFMLMLGVEKWQLNAIDRDQPTVREKLASALDLWLRNKRDASWADIVHALQRIEEKALAMHLEAKYCQWDQGGLKHKFSRAACEWLL